MVTTKAPSQSAGPSTGAMKSQRLGHAPGALFLRGGAVTGHEFRENLLLTRRKLAAGEKLAAKAPNEVGGPVVAGAPGAEFRG